MQRKKFKKLSRCQGQVKGSHLQEWSKNFVEHSKQNKEAHTETKEEIKKNAHTY